MEDDGGVFFYQSITCFSFCVKLQWIHEVHSLKSFNKEIFSVVLSPERMLSEQ